MKKIIDQINELENTSKEITTTILSNPEKYVIDDKARYYLTLLLITYTTVDIKDVNFEDVMLNDKLHMAKCKIITNILTKTSKLLNKEICTINDDAVELITKLKNMANSL